jgi:hypothetical protein
MPLDIEQSDDEVAAWLETEFGSAIEFFHWFTLLGSGDQEKLRRLALALDRPH